MNWKWHHPWWTHLPALGCVAINAAMLWAAHPPARVPVHFGWNGQANRWGSPVEIWIALVGVPLAAVLGWVALDEANARYEERKRFNWLALLDEALAGFFTGLVMGIIPQLSAPHPVLSGFWPSSLVFMAGAVLIAAVLEWLRPYQPMQRPREDFHTLALSGVMAEIADPSKRWMYWEAQNPLYLQVLIPVTAILLIAAGVVSFPAIPWLLPFYVLCVAILLACWGGLHVSVNRECVRARLGVVGIPLLRIPLRDIAAIEAVSFNPLGDFGGWGIRYSLRKRMWGFYFYGSRGVQITTRAGKSYLIGSDDPERLAGMCQAARRADAAA